MLELLTRATELLASSEAPRDHERTAWKLAKAAYDYDDFQALDLAFDHLLDSEDALGGPVALKALPPLTQRWWDRRGYHDKRPAELWRRFSESAQAAGDPWLAATGQAQRAWHLSCSGDLDTLDELVDHYLHLEPRRFGEGPHRHPDAPDTPTSLWWAQLTLLRPALWNVAWQPRRRRAEELIEALLDATDAAEIDLETSAWNLDAAMRAALANELTEFVSRWGRPWLRTLRTLNHPRASFHRTLAEGLMDLVAERPTSITKLQQAQDLANASTLGPEWRADALQQRLAAQIRFEPSNPPGDAHRELKGLHRTFGLWGAAEVSKD